MGLGFFGRATLATSALWLLIGCGPPGAGGELGNGTFEYACADNSDAICDSNCDDFFGCTQDVQNALRTNNVALGASFRTEYHSRSGGLETIHSVSPNRLAQTLTGQFEAKETGWVSLIGETPAGHNDIFHLYVEEMSAIQLTAGAITMTEGQPIMVQEGDTLLLRAVPTGEDGDMLAGALGASWSVADSAMLTINGSTGDNEVSLRGSVAGTTTVSVTIGELSVTYDVEIAPSGVGGSGGDGGDGGTGGDGGSGGDGGMGGGGA